MNTPQHSSQDNTFHLVKKKYSNSIFMSLFSKIKNALEQEEACVISKHGTPL